MKMNRSNILKIIGVIAYIILVVAMVPFPLGDDMDTLGKLLRPYELVFIGSVIFGTIAGASGLKIFHDVSDKVHTFIHGEKESIDNDTYTSKILNIIESPMRISDQLESERLRTGIKIATLILVPFIIVYTIYIIVCVAFAVMLVLMVIAFIIGFVCSILGIELPGLPSFGGGGGSGGGGGKDYTPKYGKTYDSETGERVVKQDGKTYRRGSIFELDAGWHADKEWTGGDKVERDWDGSPKIRRDVTGKQIIEGDSSDDPIIEPESEQDK